MNKELKAYLDNQFKHIDQRFEQVENRLDTLESIQLRMENKFTDQLPCYANNLTEKFNKPTDSAFDSPAGDF